MDYSETFINNHWYMTFYQNKENVGKIVFDKFPSHLFLVFISIEKKFRGQGYLKKFLDILSNLYYVDMVIEAKEHSEKYNRLINHYIKHGFIITSTPRYEYQGDFLFRKILMRKYFKD